MKNKTTSIRRILMLLATSVLGASSGLAGAATLTFPATPLFVTNSAAPNIMFMLDSSGSMNNVVADTPYVDSFSYSCTGTNVISTVATPDDATPQIEVFVPASGVPKIGIWTPASGSRSATVPTAVCGGGVTTNCMNSISQFGNGAGQKCFNPSADYFFFRGNAEAGVSQAYSSLSPNNGTYRVPSGYFPARYSGNYLNWYFKSDSVSGVTWNAGQQIKPLPTSVEPSGLVLSRIRIARPAATTIVNSLDTRLRVGLSVYNGNNGGAMRVPVADLTSAQRTALTTGSNGIANISAGGNTPLAETLSGIGRYFASGYAGNLTLTPKNPSRTVTTSVANAFPQNLASVSGSNPIALSCQSSFAVLLTDGRPTEDRGESTYLALTSPNNVMADYDGDCYNATPACLSADRKTTQIYESNNGSDYLDDVAQALYETDLRPDFANETAPPSQQFKNNVRTYMIGFADSDVQDDPLLQRTATQGGGTFTAAASASALATAFNNIITNILAQQASFSAASLNSTSISSGSLLFAASFNSGNWSGNLKAFPISSGTGGACPGVTAGRLCSEAWNAQTAIAGVTPTSRVILTSNGSGAGIPFRWDSGITNAQKTLLNYAYNNTTNIATADAKGQQRLDYIRGDRSQESASNFRVRGSALGDIVDSDPVFVGGPRAAYPFSGYSSFRSANANRIPMVYVGSNDGMLHGFRASGTGQGNELLAYVPSVLFGSASNPKLARLTAQPYTHIFGVDGSPTVADLQISSTWYSYLVGSMRYGGQALFALNVTDPSTFSESNAASIVKWEFTDANSGTEGRDLGYTFSQPAIVKMKNGKWAIIVGNGYNSGEADGNASSTTRAALFIIFADGPGGDGVWAHGSEYIRIPVGPSNQDNGLATAAPVDVDGDSLIDYIYAGDLKGNVWQFNVNSATASDWVAGYSGNPVFTARDHVSAAQPITARMEVGLNLLTTDPDDLVVYFGTGRYLESTDNSQSGQQNQSFYGIFVNPMASTNPLSETSTSPNPSRSDLVEQFVLDETTANGNPVRLTSRNPLNLTPGPGLTVHKGWFIDLYDTENATDAQAAAGLNKGERQISTPVLRNGRITFSTLIPSVNPCDFGGSGWLMQLDATTGGRPATPTLNVDNNLVVDNSDTVLLDGVAVAVSGRGSNDAIPAAPGVAALDSTLDALYIQTSDGTFLDDDAGTSGPIRTKGGRRSGRITWREITP